MCRAHWRMEAPPSATGKGQFRRDWRSSGVRFSLAAGTVSLPLGHLGRQRAQEHDPWWPPRQRETSRSVTLAASRTGKHLEPWMCLGREPLAPQAMCQEQGPQESATPILPACPTLAHRPPPPPTACQPLARHHPGVHPLGRPGLSLQPDTHTHTLTLWGCPVEW